MVRPFQLKEVKQILPFLFSHFFPVHGILHKHENRCPFLFLSYTQEPPLRQLVNKHPWKNENFGMSTNILSKIKQKTEDACISHWQKVSSKGSTITKSFYRTSTAPQAIAYFIGETIFTFNIREKVTPSWSWKWSLFSSITPCMFNSQVSLPLILVDIWKFVEVHHGCLKQNWLHDFKLIESTCLIRWPMRRLFSRVVKYAEWENPVTTTKASSRMKNDACMPFIVSTWAEFVNASKKTSVFPNESQLPSFNNNVLLIMLIMLLQ